MKRILILILTIGSIVSCHKEKPLEQVPFTWEGANIYFMLTDRFNNGDKSNDVNYGREKETAVLRGFKGGDLKGVTQKIKEGYFKDLGRH